ncbi:MAG TPA: hypothetical protein VE934_08040 [Polaromonas sp.]|uniref:hypothetical protein n=1 Tax=Polaromonas sp. TaxID=1869339 RepID=UPI002D3601F2|nr:hypothetical protein [Polaromonas sp.]HYW56895.1 hypothetical protein [Polaromonas sp.]
MKTSTTDHHFSDRAHATGRDLSTQALTRAEHAMDQSRSLASETMDRAEGTLRHLRDSIDPMVGKLTAQSQRLARQSLDAAAEATARAQRSVSRYATSTARYVSNEPVKSVLIAAAVGAGVALLVAAARKHQNR